MALRTPLQGDPYDNQGNKDSPAPKSSTSDNEDRGEKNPNLAEQEALGQDFKYTSGGTNSKSSEGDSLYRGSRGSADDKALKKHDDKVSLVNRAMGNRRKLFIGGGLGASLAGLLIAGLLFLLPLKILHIVTNLQNRFYATSESAVQKETDRMLSHYLKKYVFPAHCGSTIDKNCNPIPVLGSNPVNRMYKSWSQARLEHTLATKYGLEFTYNKKVGHYYLKTSSTSSNPVALDDFVKNDNMSLDEFLNSSSEPGLRKVNRSEIRQAFNDAMSKETLWKRTMYRFKVGSLLKQKYGIKLCITDKGCKVADKVTATVSKPKNIAKAYIAERVLMPRSEILGTVFQCLYIDPNCTPEDVKPIPCTEGVDCASNGSPQSKEEKEIQSKLDSLISKYATADAYQLYKDINDSGSVNQYLVKRVVSQVLGEAAGKTAADKIPVIGWINLAAQIDKKLRHIGPASKKLAYVTNSGSMIALFATYRTYADEIKSGNISPGDVGSFTDSLGTTSGADKGGTASAEQTPLYNSLIGSSSTSSSLANFGIGSAAYAASTKPAYICDDGKAPSKVICPEESLNTGNSIANSVSKYVNSPLMAPVNFAAGVWNWGPGKILGIIGGISQYLIAGSHIGGAVNFVLENTVPYYSDAEKKITEIAGQAMEAGVNYMIPNPFSHNMSGGRTFDMIAGGADASGNEFAHNGLGGKALSSAQVVTIMSEQNQQRTQQYNSQSFIARVFDNNSDQSPVSKLAMVMPTSVSTVSSTVASLFSNPFGRIGNIFSSMFTLHTQAASTAPQSDAFGIAQYGYTDADINAIGDPEQYWDKNCGDNPVIANGRQTTDWNNAGASSAKDDPNFMPLNTTTNPCLLLQATVGSAGAVYDSGLLTADDTAGSSSSSTSTTSTGTSSGTSSSVTAGWAWPTTPSGAVITSCYGSRHGASGGGYHPGMDIAQTEGTPVYAIQAGKVTFVGPASGYGDHFVIIETSSTLHISYGHMDNAIVKMGDTVTAGQQIGILGNQGFSTGPHLHLNLSVGAGVDQYNGNGSALEHGLTIPAGVSDPYSCSSFHYPGSK